VRNPARQREQGRHTVSNGGFALIGTQSSKSLNDEHKAQNISVRKKGKEPIVKVDLKGGTHSAGNMMEKGALEPKVARGGKGRERGGGGDVLTFIERTERGLVRHTIQRLYVHIIASAGSQRLSKKKESEE